MQVKVNGTPILLETVLRAFAPKRKDGVDFRQEDITTIEKLNERAEWLRSSLNDECKVWCVDRMGWRFLLWRDQYKNTFPVFFAPICGELEVLENDK